jgi:hypothetical protein
MTRTQVDKGDDQDTYYSSSGCSPGNRYHVAEFPPIIGYPPLAKDHHAHIPLVPFQGCYPYCRGRTLRPHTPSRRGFLHPDRSPPGDDWCIGSSAQVPRGWRAISDGAQTGRAALPRAAGDDPWPARARVGDPLVVRGKGHAVSSDGRP